MLEKYNSFTRIGLFLVSFPVILVLAWVWKIGKACVQTLPENFIVCPFLPNFADILLPVKQSVEIYVNTDGNILLVTKILGKNSGVAY